MLQVLNLYAGVGGNRKLWENVDVVAVENQQNIAECYERLYPDDTVFVEDAHQFLLDTYDVVDFIWSSPPCQTHSKMSRIQKVKKYADMALYEEILFLKHNFKGGWVVENVKPYYTPLISPTAVVGRHYFWSNFPIVADEVPQPEGFIMKTSLEGKKDLQNWLDIHFEDKLYYRGNHDPGQVLRNCVHPKLGKQILDCYENTNSV